ncbi:MAG TPA: response regulator [Ramlibacter sp.]|uniref:sensor histidine kinase n=1 Tax=Ramlibacter sp. TaxID=1917967 RepID=UPI002C915026|nr:response regulator [Ramlibacter sp.]HVZ46728.1 response regulator [Ramlibacter sp.]
MNDRARDSDLQYTRRLGHELRTPLNAVLGFSMLLLRDANLTQHQRERIGLIETAGKQLLERIDRLLEDATIVPRHGDGSAVPPGARPQPEERPARLPRLETDQQVQGTVLVVDDTPSNVELLTQLLASQGTSVLAADSGERGLALAREREPDVILLDVQMQGMTGFQTCAALKADARTRAIPVIFMTVISDATAKIAAFEAGAADYVTKPFHVDEALARVNTQLRLTQSQKQLAGLNAELEARVAQRTAQLEAAHRDLQAFCYSMAHDLRGPLGALDGFSVLLAELLQGETSQRARHYLGRIRGGVQQMDALTEALLALAHLSLRDQKGETVSLSQLARDAIERHRAADSQRHVDVKIEPDLDVMADPGLMNLLVDHLVDNAWKFTAREARAVIEVGRARQGQAGSDVFFVRDNGTGFDMAYADKLFRPFQRLHGNSDFEGVGIGLAIVDRIVLRHGGRVWAEASPGEGTTIYFTMPLGEARERLGESSGLTAPS